MEEMSRRMDGCQRMAMQPGMNGCGQRRNGGWPGMSGATRQSLMKQINEASFAMDEAVLFLDTHPDNFDALRYYRNAVSMRKEALDAYKRQFGPLLVDDVTGNTWDWVTEKWPWEGGC